MRAEPRMNSDLSQMGSMTWPMRPSNSRTSYVSRPIITLRSGKPQHLVDATFDEVTNERCADHLAVIALFSGSVAANLSSMLWLA